MHIFLLRGTVERLKCVKDSKAGDKNSKWINKLQRD